MLQEDVQRSQTTLEGDTKVSSELTQGSLYTISSDRHKDERANDLEKRDIGNLAPSLYSSLFCL